MPMQISISNSIGGGGGNLGSGGGSSFTNTKSILLDGVDDFVDCGNPISLQITGNITLSAWIKTSSTSAYEMAIGKEGVASGRRSYMLYRSGSNAKFFIHKGGSPQTVTGTSTINDGNWHHILGINNGSDIKIYVDGTLENTNVGGGGTIDNGIDNCYIGRRGGTFAQRGFFEGNIDEAAVWNSDQTANVATIFNSGVPNDLASLSPISWWRCGDGDTAPTIIDHGSGGNNGTMTNFSTFSTDVPT